MIICKKSCKLKEPHNKYYVVQTVDKALPLGTRNRAFLVEIISLKY